MAKNLQRGEFLLLSLARLPVPPLPHWLRMFYRLGGCGTIAILGRAARALRRWSGHFLAGGKEAGFVAGAGA
jgi:hypothetical protein